MAKRYKIALTIIAILFFICCLILCSYRAYLNSPENNPLVIVNDGLSINYRGENPLKITGKKEKIVFSVTNDNENKVIYYIELENINPSDKTVEYTLEEKNKKIDTIKGEISGANTILATELEIEPSATHSFVFEITSKEKINMTANLKVEKEENQEEYFASTILKQNNVVSSTKTTIGASSATENEGLIESNDDLGVSYYFRGNVENNYVEFANNLWRIVKINGDGSIKLILNDYIDSNSNFYDSSSSLTVEEKMNYENMNIYKTLNDWYQDELEKEEKNIVSSKFCIDNTKNQEENGKTYYLAHSRLFIDYNPIFNCMGNNPSSKIGLLTADEAVLAGASKDSDNTSYYLYVEGKNTSWWTITPEYSEGSDIYFFEITENGKLQVKSVGSYFRGIRPVINIAKKTVVEGSGTKENPYIIKE